MGTCAGPGGEPARASLDAYGPRDPAPSALSRLVLEGAPEQEMIDEAVRDVASTLEVELAHFLELSPDMLTLRWRAVVGWPEHFIGTAMASAESSGSLAGFVLSVGRTVVVQDLAADGRFTLEPAMRDMGVVSGIATVVLGRDGELLGVLAGQSREERAFGSLEATVLQSVADILSVGLLRRRDHGRFETLVRSSNDLIAVLDGNAVVTYCNPGARRLFGREPASLLGRSLWDFVHPEDLERARLTFGAALSRPGAKVSGTFRLSTAAGDWRMFEGSGTNCFDDPGVRGLVVNARDVTDQANLSRVLRTQSAGNRALVSATDEVSLLSETCQAISDQGGFPLAWVGYVEHDKAKTVRVVASSGPRLGYLKGFRVSWGENAHGRAVVGNAIRTSQTQVIDDLAVEPEFAPWRERAATAGLRSACALALRLGGEVIGALAIYAEEPGAFGPEELSLLAELAEDVSYGIGRLRDGASLRASEERFRALATSAPIGIIEASGSGEVQFANARAAEIVGPDVVGPMADRWFEQAHPDDLPKLVALAEHVRGGQKASARFRVARPGGGVCHVRMRVSPRGAGPAAGFVATLEDVTGEALAHEALRYQATHDPLTGLGNRAAFLDRLDRQLARRTGGSGLAVLFLDLDHFKVVNDSLGHVAGDEVLREVGARFLRGVRSGDTVARFSGDEFIFIVRGVRSPEDAAKAAGRLHALVARPIRAGGQDLRLTASTGIVLLASGADSVGVLRDADAAMYRAKAEGRARWAVFDEELRHRSVRRLALEAELHQALERQEFVVYYQPLVTPANGLPRSAEALVRWKSPDRGILPPDEFIPVAEDSGLIRPIGRWVFERAVSQVAAWDRQPRAPRLDQMSVNFSARQLDDPSTPEFVLRALERHGVRPGRLCVEVTESVLMGDSAATRRSLEAFRELGLPVAIDDFGTGYSSLAYLHALPVTTVKIDRSFVERLGWGSGASAIVKAIVEMSHALGLGVVAEGVSDANLQSLVARLGCDTAQGFHWAKPLPAAEFAKWWRQAEQRRPPSGAPRRDAAVATSA
jgi:diguanylate cyclase (GGDEF)-like protein/PAS domain S-box-containing protein